MRLSKEEQILLQHYNDLIQSSYQKGIPLFTQFAGMREAELACQALDAFYGKSWNEREHVMFYGGYPEAERKIICFLPGLLADPPDMPDFPIGCVNFTSVNKKFCDRLTHRDYLGTVMGLGITRGQIGDILTHPEENGSPAYLFCIRDKEDLVAGITRIKHTAVTARAISFGEFDFKPSFRELAGSVSSFRLDAVLAFAAKIPRSKSLGLIQAGQVFLNGRRCTENAKKLKEGDVFSARGYGKFLFVKANSVTKKGRCHIIVKQYM